MNDELQPARDPDLDELLNERHAPELIAERGVWVHPREVALLAFARLAPEPAQHVGGKAARRMIRLRRHG